MNEHRGNNTSRQFPIIAGLVGFAVGVLGNLIAAWLQQELLRNAFTPWRVAFILGLAALGLLVGTWLDRRGGKESTLVESDRKHPQAAGLQWDNVRLLWSRVKSRGRGIGLDRVLSLGSDIDIDTRDHEENRDV